MRVEVVLLLEGQSAQRIAVALEVLALGSAARSDSEWHRRLVLAARRWVRYARPLADLEACWPLQDE